MKDEKLLIGIDISREDSSISLKDRYLQTKFDVKCIYTYFDFFVDGDRIRLVNVDPIASFINSKLSTRSGNQIENKVETADFACLMYKVITSRKDSDDLSIGFHRDVQTRKI